MIYDIKGRPLTPERLREKADGHDRAAEKGEHRLDRHFHRARAEMYRDLAAKVEQTNGD
jgi:hypothetical protein